MSSYWETIYEAGNRAFGGGLYELALASYLNALSLARESDDRSALGATLRALAKTYLELRQTPEALDAAGEAEQIDTEFWGAETPQTAESMFLLAEAMRRQGQFGQARVRLDRVLALRILFFGETHDDSLAVLIKLIWLDLQEDRHDSSIELMRRAVEVFSRLHPTGAFAKSLNLKVLLQQYVDEKRYQEGELISERLQLAMRAVLGDSHPEIAHALSDCSIVKKMANGHLSAWRLKSRSDAMNRKFESDRWSDGAAENEEGLSTSAVGPAPVHDGSAGGVVRFAEASSTRSLQSDRTAPEFESPAPLQTDYFQRTLILAGLEMSPEKLNAIVISSALTCGGLSATMYLLSGFPGLVVDAFILGALLSTASICVYLLIASMMRQRRIADQLPDALEIMVSLLRGGNPIVEAFKQVSVTSPLPIRADFARAVATIQTGHTLKQALSEMVLYVRTPAMRSLADSINVSQSSGGNIAERIATIAKEIRDNRSGKKLSGATGFELKIALYVICPGIALSILRVLFQPSFGAPILSFAIVQAIIFLTAIAAVAFIVTITKPTVRIGSGSHRGPQSLDATSLVTRSWERTLLHLSKTKKKNLITGELPGFIDLALIYIESGVSLPQAIHKVRTEASASCPTLCLELEQSLQNLKTFKSSIPNAFKKIGERYDIPELINLGSTIDAAERTRSSVGNQLREQSNSIRSHLKFKQKERAGWLAAVGLILLAVCKLFLMFH